MIGLLLVLLWCSYSILPTPHSHLRSKPRHHRLLHMQAILGFIDDEAAWRIHHCVGRLDVAAQRQAMTEDAVVGQRHPGFVDDEMLVPVAHGFLILPVTKIRQRTPALGIDHVSAGVGRFDVVADPQRAAVFRDVLPRPVHVALVEHVLRCRAQQGHVHAHARGDGQRRIGNGGIERLRVVSPGQHVFPAAQVRCLEVFLQRHHVREFLAGMGDRLHVDHRHRGVCGETAQHLVLAIDGPVDELRERTHADHVDIARQHLRHFDDVLLGFAIHDCAEVELDRPGILARLQHHRMAAEMERS